MHVLTISELINIHLMNWTIETADRTSVSNLADMIIRDIDNVKEFLAILRSSDEKKELYNILVLARRYSNYLKWSLNVLNSFSYAHQIYEIEDILNNNKIGI